MIGKKLSRYLYVGTFALVLLTPALAFAAEEAAASSNGLAEFGKFIGAALCIGLAAIGGGYAQAKIGSAGQGTLAERPEERIWVVTLTALPEVIVLLGFVMAILLLIGLGGE